MHYAAKFKTWINLAFWDSTWGCLWDEIFLFCFVLFCFVFSAEHTLAECKPRAQVYIASLNFVWKDKMTFWLEILDVLWNRSHYTTVKIISKFDLKVCGLYPESVCLTLELYIELFIQESGKIFWTFKLIKSDVKIQVILASNSHLMTKHTKTQTKKKQVRFLDNTTSSIQQISKQTICFLYIFAFTHVFGLTCYSVFYIDRQK